MDDEDPVCRICRGQGDSEEPLFHPCKCTGSIKFVHQTCLTQWLYYTPRANKCDLCDFPYNFTKTYHPDMPENLPLHVLVYELVLTFIRIIGPVFGLLVSIAIVCFLSVAMAALLKVTNLWMNYNVPLHTKSLLNIVNEIADTLYTHPLEPHFMTLTVSRFGPFVQTLFALCVDGILEYILFAVAFILVYTSMWALEDEALQTDLVLIDQGQHGRLDIDLDPLANFEREFEADRTEARRIVVPDPRTAEEIDREVLNIEIEPVEEIQDADDNPLVDIFLDIVETSILVKIQFLFSALPLSTLFAFTVHDIFNCVGRYVTFLVVKICHPQSLGSLQRYYLSSMPWYIDICVTIIGYALALGCLFLTYVFSYDILLRSPKGRAYLKATKQIITVVKVTYVLVAEHLMFPCFCGILIRMALLPVSQDMHPRDFIASAVKQPYLTVSLLWFSGIFYMYILASFINLCRQFLRRGVFYFVQDPSNAVNDPVRNIITHSVGDHMYKITLSGCIYCILILGGFLSITGLLRLTGVVPHLLRPLNFNQVPSERLLLLCAIMTLRVFYFLVSPNVEFQHFVRKIQRTEFIRAARKLDLMSFLFNEVKTPTPKSSLEGGHFVRAPSYDHFASRKGHRLFIPVDENDKLLEDPATTQHREELESYIVVWRPAYFMLRVCCLLVWLWVVNSGLVMLYLVAPLLGARTVAYFTLGDALQNDVVLEIFGQVLRQVSLKLWAKAKGSNRTQLIQGSLAASQVFGYGLCLALLEKRTSLPHWATTIFSPSPSVVLNAFLIASVLWSLSPQVAPAGDLRQSLSTKVLIVGVFYAASTSRSGKLDFGLTLYLPAIVVAWDLSLALCQKLQVQQRLRAFIVRARDDYYSQGINLSNFETS